MDKNLIGLISGGFVVLSIIPYAIRTYRKEIHPHIVSWFLWSLIGLTLLLTYKSSGANSNVWPAIFGFLNPCLIAILLIRNREEFGKLKGFDFWCLGLGIISLIAWIFIKDNKNFIQYALYTSILADAFAAIPTLNLLWEKPWEDRPFAWGCFSFGYGLSIFSISEHTVANYALPVYMFLGPFFIFLPLIFYRVNNYIGLRPQKIVPN